MVQHDSDPALCTVHAAQTQSTGGAALRRLLHATQTLAPSSFSMVHVVHVQPDAELEAVLETVLEAELEAVLGAVFLAAGGAGVAQVRIGRRAERGDRCGEREENAHSGPHCGGKGFTTAGPRKALLATDVRGCVYV